MITERERELIENAKLVLARTKSATVGGILDDIQVLIGIIERQGTEVRRLQAENDTLRAEVDYRTGKARDHFAACMGCDEELKRVQAENAELRQRVEQGGIPNEWRAFVSGLSEMRIASDVEPGDLREIRDEARALLASATIAPQNAQPVRYVSRQHIKTKPTEANPTPVRVHVVAESDGFRIDGQFEKIDIDAIITSANNAIVYAQNNGDSEK